MPHRPFDPADPDAAPDRPGDDAESPAPWHRLRWFIAGALTGAVLGYAASTALGAPTETRANSDPARQSAATGDRAEEHAAPPPDTAPPERAAPDGPAPSPRATEGSDPGATTGAPTTTAHAHEHGPAPDGWDEACRGFAETFTNVDLGERWHDAVAAWMTPAQADEYADVPLENVPTGAVDTVTPHDPQGALFTECEVRYDSGLAVDVGLTYHHPDWLVAAVRPAG